MSKSNYIINNSKSNNSYENDYDLHTKQQHAEAEDAVVDSYGIFNSCQQHKHKDCKQVLPKFASTASYICNCKCHSAKDLTEQYKQKLKQSKESLIAELKRLQKVVCTSNLDKYELINAIFTIQHGDNWFAR